MSIRPKPLSLPQLTLQVKLMLSFAVLLVIFASVSVYHRNQVNGIHDQVLHQNREMSKQQLALELKIKTNEIDAIKSGFLISKDEGLIGKFEASQKEFYTLVEQIADTASNADQRKWSAKLKNTSTEYTATFGSAVDIVRNKSLTPTEMSGQLAKLHELSQVHKEYIFELVDQFNQAYAQDVQAAIAGSNAYVDSSLHASLLSLSVVLLVSITVAAILIRSFVKPIRRLQEAVKRIAEGDLSHSINQDSRDELGMLSRDFDHMVEQVRLMLANTKRIASTLSVQSETFREFSGSTATVNRDIVRAIEEISVGSEQQARHTESSSAAISELSAQIRDMASLTNEVQRKSREAAFNTYTGTESMEGLQTSARHSEAVLQQVFAAMDTLSASSTRIGQIVNSITDISTQTNVLALNAAIEAARAGVHGRGFSVIAEEVRLLSGQTNESSKQVGSIVKTLTRQIQELETSLEEARHSLAAQNSKMAQSSTAFQDIRLSMDELAGHIGLIHERIEAAEGKNNELVRSVQHVAAIAQETAAGVEEVNASSLRQDAAIHRIAQEADDMMILAQRLFDEINEFKIGHEEPTDSDHGHVQGENDRKQPIQDEPSIEERDYVGPTTGESESGKPTQEDAGQQGQEDPVKQEQEEAQGKKLLPV